MSGESLDEPLQIERLQSLQHAMQQQGIRRLLVLSGDDGWCLAQAAKLSACFPGDWWWISEQAPADAQGVAASQATNLLGQQALHGVFDARRGLHAEALAAFSGILQAGSWLVLLLPAWHHWPEQPDTDSVRWSEQALAMPTPNFVRRLQQLLLQRHSQGDCLLFRQGVSFPWPSIPPRPQWQPATGQPTAEQQAILSELLRVQQGIWVLTAARGRGKSTLAGMLVQRWSGTCWITAPNRLAASAILQQCPEPRFVAPDAIVALAATQAFDNIDWLIIDEAAAIPLPVLARLVTLFPRVLLTSTVEGYEGTGRGFLLKFCATLPAWQDRRLQQPLRWATDDPLENWGRDALLLHEQAKLGEPNPEGSWQLREISQDDWLHSPQLLAEFYGLLTSAHYRTSPMDLRRLMDAPGMHFAALSLDQHVMAAIWLVDEGGLPAQLAHDVWAGRRRPRGNLVAQSLAAHGSQWQAPLLRSRRISRIAVVAGLRRQGLAQQLVKHQVAQASLHSVDFLSVSFGYTEQLWQFWQQCGFRLVRIGSQQEASSGCYTAMALMPLSAAGSLLVSQAQYQWSREQLRMAACQTSSNDNSSLSDADWQALAGFAFAHRPLENSQGVLWALLQHSALALPALRGVIEHHHAIADLVLLLGLTGRKAFLQCCRDEAAMAMQHIDADYCRHWQNWAAPGGFSSIDNPSS